MLSYEFKLYGASAQFRGIDEAIQTTQFVRNKCLQVWLDEYKKPASERASFGLLSFGYMCKDIAASFDFARKLNAMARQAAAERCARAVMEFYKRCKLKKAGLLGNRKVGYPRFQHDCRSVEYKTGGWKLAADCQRVKFTDGHGIGWMKLVGGRYMAPDMFDKIKRLRVVRKADGYYAQFCVDVNDVEHCEPTGRSIGLDLGVTNTVTDSLGVHTSLPSSLARQHRKLRKQQRQLSRKKKGSRNRTKARRKLARTHLKITRQRQDFATKFARDVTRSNDLIVMEDLQVQNMSASAKGTADAPGKRVSQKAGLNRSILNANWGRIRTTISRYCTKFGRRLLLVPPQYTSQRCSSCGYVHADNRKTQAEFQCGKCGLRLHADHNAALNILALGLDNAAGHAVSACGAPVRLPVKRKRRASKQETVSITDYCQGQM